MELGMAAAGAAAAAEVGVELFEYNRRNYMFDQKLHWARFNLGANLAIAQVEQYRQDVADLTALTTGRMDLYHALAAMIGTIATAILAEGRLGLNAPAPPSWHMGLVMVNLAGAYVFLGLTIWMAMHAALRAGSASTHMLTRFVRLPVPGLWMLDRARKFLASFEEQPLREAFRIPFFRHQFADKQLNEKQLEMDPDALRRTRHGNDVPAWYRMEKVIDQSEPYESMMPLQARGTAPEHFEVYREIQNEWWPFDVYSRLSLFISLMHLTHCWTYQAIGHYFSETRSIFAAGCVVIPVSTFQQILLTLDIMPSHGERLPLQRLAPFAQFLAWIGLCIEYKRWWDQAEAIIGYICVYSCYAIHIIYTLQLLRICSPDYDRAPDQSEVPAGSWWPGSWALPRAFKHAIWLVAPPRHLEEGQNDLAGEVRAEAQSVSAAAKQGIDIERKCSKRRDVHRALGTQGESPAWFNVRTGLLAILLSWCYLVIGFSVDLVNQGTPHPSLLSAPGLPDMLRDPRYRPPKFGSDEAPEAGTGGIEMGLAKGMRPFAVERRLQNDMLTACGMGETHCQNLAERMTNLLPQLGNIIAGRTRKIMQMEPMPPVDTVLMQTFEGRVNIRWPALFHPRLLACGSSSVGKVLVALAQHGRGALIVAPAIRDSSEDINAKALAFSLQGTAAYGPLLSATWDAFGLLLSTASGVLLECPGEGPDEGIWRCQPLSGLNLPFERTQLSRGSVAVSRSEGSNKVSAFEIAVAFPGERAVSVFSHSGTTDDFWIPTGEVQISTEVASMAFSPTERELLVATVDGGVSRLNLRQGSTQAVSHHRDSQLSNSQALCFLPGGRYLRLIKPVAEDPMLLFG